MIKRIPVEELKTGVYVCGVEKEGNAVFFINNILLKSEGEIERLLRSGYSYAHIELDERRAKDPIRRILPPEEAPRHSPAEVDFQEELKVAKKVRDEAEGVVKSFLNSARLGRDIDTQSVHETVGKMVASVFRNHDALASLAMLKNYDDYTFGHSVNVCIISLAVGRQMDLSKEALHELGVGAILHDVGKMLIPERILRKPGGLTEAEYGEMQRHAALGADLLSKTNEISDDSIRIPLEHHERVDGTGYHGRLRGEKIHTYSRIAAVADTYDAMTSARVYQQPMLPDEVLRKMYLWRGTRLDPEMVERLIRCLGIYPVGSIVELNTGELGVVRMGNKTTPLKPVVMLVCDGEKKPFTKPFEIDLRNEETRWIVSSKDPASFVGILEGLIA